MLDFARRSELDEPRLGFIHLCKTRVEDDLKTILLCCKGTEQKRDLLYLTT